MKRAVSDTSAIRLRFRSSDGLNTVREKLSEYDAAVEVKKLSVDSYELSVPKNSDLATEYFPQAADGKIPDKLPGGFEVVTPVLVESLSSTGFLIGERTDELW